MSVYQEVGRTNIKRKINMVEARIPGSLDDFYHPPAGMDSQPIPVDMARPLVPVRHLSSPNGERSGEVRTQTHTTPQAIALEAAGVEVNRNAA